MGCGRSCLLDSLEFRRRKSLSGVSTPSTTVLNDRVMTMAGINHESFSARVHDTSRRLSDEYKVDGSKVVGTGFSGPVRLGVSRLTGKMVAIKSFNKRILTVRRLEFLRNEVAVYLHIDHPNIARLLDVYEDSESVDLVMEFCSGKELYHRLVRKSCYSETDAAKTTYEMLLAINYLHEHDVVHRDIKLENFLYEDESEKAKLKLIDFGFSRIMQHERLHASCGSIHYVAPEVLTGDYDSQCDLWSLGVVVYMLLSGSLPFEGFQEDVLDSIRLGKYKMSGNRWRNISSSGKDFVKKLLIVNPKDRLTASQAIKHPWIAESGKRTSTEMEVPREVLENIRMFAMSNHLQRAALSMMAYSFSSDDISDLHDIFLAMDSSETGTIKLSELVIVMQKRLDLSQEEMMDIFGKLDRAHHGEIEYTSFLAASMSNRMKLHDNLIRHVFDQLDHNHDGFLTLEDLRAALGSTIDGDDIEICIREADLNGDGLITYEEFHECFVPQIGPIALDRTTSLAKIRAVSALSKLKTRSFSSDNY